MQELKEINRSKADEAIELIPNERNILMWKGLVKVHFAFQYCEVQWSS